MKQLGIDKEHKIKIDEITKYMEENRIQELFNVNITYLKYDFLGNLDEHFEQSATKCQTVHHSMLEEHPASALKR